MRPHISRHLGRLWRVEYLVMLGTTKERKAFPAIWIFDKFSDACKQAKYLRESKVVEFRAAP